jgi:hypothetical protein
MYTTMGNTDQIPCRNRCPVRKRKIFQYFALHSNFTTRSKKKHSFQTNRNTYRVLLLIIAATLSGNCPISTFFQQIVSSNPLYLSRPRSLHVRAAHIQDGWPAKKAHSRLPDNAHDPLICWRRRPTYHRCSMDSSEVDNE